MVFLTDNRMGHVVIEEQGSVIINKMMALEYAKVDKSEILNGIQKGSSLTVSAPLILQQCAVGVVTPHDSTTVGNTFTEKSSRAESVEQQDALTFGLVTTLQMTVLIWCI
ncbi:hypothetical protein BS78_K272200 [Paspalum vaginatum]|uniref:Uncharacterized protein n=1 Tax=Paspalum vaginatum TaxID=158149 RepID=A0A9W7X8F6_9POAL|nr:hypothetical protein BS78_K272200 [Paspalum vaginatum]